MEESAARALYNPDLHEPHLEPVQRGRPRRDSRIRSSSSRRTPSRSRRRRGRPARGRSRRSGRPTRTSAGRRDRRPADARVGRRTSSSSTTPGDDDPGARAGWLMQDCATARRPLGSTCSATSATTNQPSRRRRAPARAARARTCRPGGRRRVTCMRPSGPRDRPERCREIPATFAAAPAERLVTTERRPRRGAACPCSGSCSRLASRRSSSRAPVLLRRARIGDEAGRRRDGSPAPAAASRH